MKNNVNNKKQPTEKLLLIYHSFITVDCLFYSEYGLKNVLSATMQMKVTEPCFVLHRLLFEFFILECKPSSHIHHRSNFKTS